MIAWFARNPVAANLMMLAFIVAGVMSARSLPLETFPAFDFESVNITTVFRGATPKSVEDGITTRIEEAVYDLEGIEEISSRSSEGKSVVSIDIADNYDKRDLLNDVKIRVDSLNTLPSAAEKPVVSLSTFNPAVIYIAAYGDVDNKALRSVADNVRDDLLLTDAITLVELEDVANFEITVEIPPQTLQDYNLTLEQVGQRIRTGSIDLSAGNLKTQDGDILIRTDGQAYNATDFSRIPIINNPTGKPILLGEIAQVVDGFEEKPLSRKFNGKPAVMMGVLRVGDQSAIEIAQVVRDYITDNNDKLPQGIALEFWDDDSLILKRRIATLVNSGLQGGLLVILLLSLFLRPAVGFWVFVGVPVSFMGGFIFLYLSGNTLNIFTVFSFILVLGVVVDDAIVTGENIYRRMRDGEDSLQASINGTREIAAPVTFGILTTVAAFFPLSDLGSSRVAFFAANIPIVVIPVLLLSLVESKFVLPSHLSHVRPRRESNQGRLARLQMATSRGLENFVELKYQPFLKLCLNHRPIVLTILLCFSALIVALAQTGHLRFTYFPEIDREEITIMLTMPDTTGFNATQANIDYITDIVSQLQQEYTDPKTGVSVIRHIYTTAGSAGRRSLKTSAGRVQIELIPPQERHFTIGTSEIGRELRKRIGTIPGAQSLSIRTRIGQDSRAPFNIQISGNNQQHLAEVLDDLHSKLRDYPNLFDIQDNLNNGKEQINLELKPRAYALGLSLADVAQQVRSAVFGFEAQRIQRGREELRVMVKYPLAYRSSVGDLNNLPIRVNGQEIPLSDIAIIQPASSPTVIYRLNRATVLNITADIDKKEGDINAIVNDLDDHLTTLKQRYTDVAFEFKGEQEEQEESSSKMQRGLFITLIVIYALLAIPFKSYLQPLIVMSVIPFSLVGAFVGHLITGYSLSFLSMVGMLALVGVIVNDSLVLVDQINRRRAAGASVYDAVVSSGQHRFRAILLTSLTTFVGLTPLLLDQSTQARFLSPIAISLGFGILYATVITLIILPIFYLTFYNLKRRFVVVSNNLIQHLKGAINKPELSRD